MSSPEFDNVKVEKEKAIAMFNRFRNIAKLQQVLEVAVALAVLSCSSVYLPDAFRTSGQHLATPFSNPHVVFLIGNSIIVMLFVLSRQNGARVNACNGDSSYENPVANTDVQQPTTSVPEGGSATSPQPSKAESTDGGGGVNNEKQIDCSANTAVGVNNEKQIDCSANTAVGVNNEKKIDCSANGVRQTQCDVVATAIEEATKKIRRLQKTKSEKLKRDISAKTKLQLRRQQTERQIVLSSGERRIVTSLDTVDSLSNEDFRLAIEAVIAQHRKFLYEQRLAEEYH